MFALTNRRIKTAKPAKTKHIFTSACDPEEYVLSLFIYFLKSLC